jgi:membrane fusion protein, multidrug efflux system
MKKFLIVLLVLAVVITGWLVLKHHVAETVPDAAEKPTARVETVTLKSQSIAQTIEAFGVVGSAPSGEQVMAAPYDCVVRNVHVAVGAQVAAGELLLEIDPSPDTQLALDSAHSLLALADKSLAATQERYDLKLATNQELLTAQQAEQEARLRAASLEARGLGGGGKIVARAAGVVSKLEIFSGSLATLGTPLITLAASGQRLVHLGIEPAQAGSVTAGQGVILSSSHRDGLETISAVVSAVGALFEPVSGAIDVQVALPENTPLLLGEHVRAEIEIAKRDSVLVVPHSAVLPDNDKQVLFTVKEGKAVRHEVTLGLASDEGVEVTSTDLRVGDTVVKMGNYELEDGMAVQAAEKESPKEEKGRPEARP